MKFIEELKEIGLSDRGSKVYLALLKKSPISGGDLSKFLSMDRTHTYNILRNLINKGLASSIIKNKKTLFQANSPKNLFNHIKKKENVIREILPGLESLKKETIIKPNVAILEGKSGIRTILRELFESNTNEVLVFGGTGKSYEILKYEMGHHEKRTQKQKIKGKIITSSELSGKLFTKLPNFKIKYIKELTNTSTMIFGNKISINVFEDKPFIILIDNKSVAQSYKKYFRYLWRAAKR
ncbi:hypothetical protein CMI42_04835 [Candidatus Pacearchaeota archaeon]|nr:hypothetical protein [Candidatus Pacearchaeota archaeon]|tara:strand:+ start:346 stop:1062 length:717 start_codon:yes stop_codon:yes gene_type:complete